jgi:hypothetical protein
LTFTPDVRTHAALPPASTSASEPLMSHHSDLSAICLEASCEVGAAAFTDFASNRAPLLFLLAVA